jgi:16S rRNA (cytosine1402-N4)-methyltransferase
MSDYHEPVMGPEVLDYLAPSDEGFYLDGTVGGGGHTRLILEACAGCRVLAVDRDPDALDEARESLADLRTRVRFLETRFDRSPADPEVRDRGLDGVLLDLGVSSRQLDADERGFTFRRGVSLDMRMEGAGRDARDFLAEADEEELTRVFRDFGEEPRARRLAREVIKRRATQPLSTSDDLVAAIAVSMGRSPSTKEKARIFQAVRIAVNGELEALESGLPAIRDVMKAGGVMVVIAYHSLEDRAVKHAFREWSRSCVCPPESPVCTCRGHALGETLTRKVVRPQAEEVERNPRARSARLRAWRRAA